MSIPHIEQTYTDTTLKGFILRNLRPNPNNDPALKAANDYLNTSVDNFWNDVVVPLREKGSFVPDKINWYFEIYKEALEVRKANAVPFPFGMVGDSEVDEIKEMFENAEMKDYIEMGTSTLSTVYSLLTNWLTRKASAMRLEKLYYSNTPVDWILKAEEEEHGIMSQKPSGTEDIMPILSKIGLIMSMKL